MSNPHPPTTPPPSDPQPPRDPVEERKSASPLIWILVLLAVLAFGWYLTNQRGSVSTAPEPAAPPDVAIGDGQDAAAERERAADDARQRAARDTAEPRTPASDAPSTRQQDRDATPITRVEPVYPPTAYRAREEGTVLVTAGIDASGAPVSVDVARRSGSRALDRAAVDAVRQWRFEPAMQGGKAVASTVEVPVSFRLDR